jgi:hypothetical protein
LCTDFIGKSLNAKNLLEIVVLAYQYNSEELKKSVAKFLEVNSNECYLKKLIKTDEWWKSMMEHRELANKIVDGIIDK